MGDALATLAANGARREYFPFILLALVAGRKISAYLVSVPAAAPQAAIPCSERDSCGAARKNPTTTCARICASFRRVMRALALPYNLTQVKSKR